MGRQRSIKKSEVPPFSRRVGYLAPVGSGWMIAAVPWSAWGVCQAVSYSSGAEVAQFLLDAAGVVPTVDVGEDRVLGLIPGPPRGPIHQLDLQRRPEILHQRIVITVPCGPHRRQDPVIRQPTRETKRRIVGEFNRSSQHLN